MEETQNEESKKDFFKEFLKEVVQDQQNAMIRCTEMFLVGLKGNVKSTTTSECQKRSMSNTTITDLSDED